MKYFRLQVPVNTNTMVKVKEKALEMGFSSVQDMVKVFLAGVANDTVKIGFGNKSEVLSPEAEECLWKEKERLDEKIRQGKAKFYTNADEMIEDLKKN